MTLGILWRNKPNVVRGVDIRPGFQGVRERGEPGPVARGYHRPLGIVVPHLDDLARPPLRPRVEIQAVVIARAVVGQRDPARMPPVLDNSAVRATPEEIGSESCREREVR